MTNRIVSLLALAGLLAACDCLPKDEPEPQSVSVGCGAERPVTLFRNCTGSYLRIDGKDWRICNYQAVNGIADNAVLSVHYERVEANAAACKDDQVVCAMYHPHEGLVEIKEVSVCSSVAR